MKFQTLATLGRKWNLSILKNRSVWNVGQIDSVAEGKVQKVKRKEREMNIGKIFSELIDAGQAIMKAKYSASHRYKIWH